MNYNIGNIRKAAKSLMWMLVAVSALALVLSCKARPEAANTQQDLTSQYFDIENSRTALAVEEGNFVAYKTSEPITIDGCGKEQVWSTAEWFDMNYTWMGAPVTDADYYGRFKLAWDEDFLYLLVEVTDDFLNATLNDGVENYWKGDYVEVFIDEDGSGGDHKFNHQAFAYHVSTEGHAIDKSTREETVFFDDHVNVQRSQQGTKHVWEMAIRLFDKEFDETSRTNSPVQIKAQKRIGFSVAYGDNDGNQTRENFMGSKKNHGVNNDEGYTNADVFGSILFME